MTSVEPVRGGLPQIAKYQIREEIGRGGMATVYRALDTRLGREVAVKVIHPHLRDSAEVASRFHTEATAVAKLRHGNIVEVYDVSDPAEAERYLVVELVRGTTLRQLLADHGAMPPEIAAALAIELLDALAHAHASGVIHRDIKPENVLVGLRPRSASDDRREQAGRVSVKLADFGIAKLLDTHGVTSTGQVLGSPAHMAPEQIEGREVDARADVFGLGVLMYECLVGHLPFEGANPAQVLRRVLDGRYPQAEVERPSVGSRWSAIVDRALAHERDARFSGAALMRDAVDAELGRLGFVPAAAELEAWLDDPKAYVEPHRLRIVERLCTLGDEGRRRRDTLVAASDYNRALANAPNDPRLLRIVTGIHRAEARKRFAMWAGGSAVAAVVCAGAARGIFALAHAPDHTVAPSASSMAVASASAASVSVDVRQAARGGDLSVATALELEAPAARPSGSPTVRPRAPVDAAPRRAAEATTVERTITFDMTPPMGVSVTVDEQSPRSVATGDQLTLDGAEHVLVFSCPVCTPVRRSVSAGDQSETLLVAVPVKPGTLVVAGAVGNTYQLVEHPELTVRAGANTIALRSAFERVTVKEMESGATASVRLEAGKTVQATFGR